MLMLLLLLLKFTSWMRRIHPFTVRKIHFYNMLYYNITKAEKLRYVVS